MLKQPSPTQASAFWCNPARIERARKRSRGAIPVERATGGCLLQHCSSLQLLRVARTIADLNDRASIDRNAVAEASCFRCTDLLKQPGFQ